MGKVSLVFGLPGIISLEIQAQILFKKTSVAHDWNRIYHLDTVDGRNPAPPRMYETL